MTEIQLQRKMSFYKNIGVIFLVLIGALFCILALGLILKDSFNFTYEERIIVIVLWAIMFIFFLIICGISFELEERYKERLRKLQERDS